MYSGIIQVIGFKSHAMNGNPFYAEALALCDGLRLAWERGFRKLICESDNLELVKTVQQGGSLITHAHGQILSDIRELLNRNWVGGS